MRGLGESLERASMLALCYDLLEFTKLMWSITFEESFSGYTVLSPFGGSIEHIVLKVIEKVLPLPTSDTTITLPPICSIIYLQMERPNPLPVGLAALFSSKFEKFKNSLSN
jgi:hypothetical protein